MHLWFEIHRGWAMNLRKVREIHPTDDGGWELKLRYMSPATFFYFDPLTL